VLTRAERAALPGDEPWSDRLVFCAKEAAYKALFPVTRQLLDFRDVEVEVDPSRGSFRATVRPRGLPAGVGPVLDSRFIVMDDLIATAVEVPA
jgi:4'-phosphopantetheinyl transferase EntD